MSFRDLQIRDWEQFSETQARAYLNELAAALPQAVSVAGLSKLHLRWADTTDCPTLMSGSTPAAAGH
jgi:hypothetical protein